MTRVLVLMSRLSDYMLNCLTHWHQDTGVELHVVRRKIDNAAPFQFEESQKGIVIHQREEFNLAGLQDCADRLNPNLIICFGWMDRDYLSVVRSRSSNCLAVMTMDNQWMGTMRQRAGLLWSRFRIQPHFDHVWVPGKRQRHFAHMLGFARGQIYEGLYVANTVNFDPIWRGLNGRPPAKRLIFTGRYVPEKGLDVLWDAFSAYHEQTDSALELWCMGTGPLDASKPEHPKIRHMGFVQPAEFAGLLKGGGIFILPSQFEPWGLVVQEFALAGFPLILSRNVGAGDCFLGDDNGLLLPEVSKDAIVKAITQIDALSERDLTAMSHASRARAEQMSVEDWVGQANAFLGDEP